MNTRAGRGSLLAWLPRGALILTAVLAPVIDRVAEPGPGSGVRSTAETLDAGTTAGSPDGGPGAHEELG